MRWFTWMAVLDPQGPPDIPQATPLPVPGKNSSQCCPRHLHSPRVRGLRGTSQIGACASPVLSRPLPHNPVITPRTISPSSPQEGGSSPRDTQIKYKPNTSHTKWNANNYTSLSHQEPACKYSSSGIPERSSTCCRYLRLLRHLGPSATARRAWACLLGSRNCSRKRRRRVVPRRRRRLRLGLYCRRLVADRRRRVHLRHVRRCGRRPRVHLRLDCPRLAAERRRRMHLRHGRRCGRRPCVRQQCGGRRRRA